MSPGDSADDFPSLWKLTFHSHPLFPLFNQSLAQETALCLTTGQLSFFKDLGWELPPELFRNPSQLYQLDHLCPHDCFKELQSTASPPWSLQTRLFLFTPYSFIWWVLLSFTLSTRLAEFLWPVPGKPFLKWAPCFPPSSPPVLQRSKQRLSAAVNS